MCSLHWLRVVLLMTEHLDNLIGGTVHMLREARANYKNPIMLWAGGKDSTVLLHLAREAYLGTVPMPVVFVDTTFQFTETKEFMDMVTDRWKLDRRIAQNRKALMEGVCKERDGSMVCCTRLKTDALLDYIRKNKVDGVFEAIRRDEHYVRNKSKDYVRQRDPDHDRIHPILYWTESDIWDYTKKFNVPYNPLYDRVEHGNLRYRSIGCYPCTKPVSPEGAERAGRSQDKEDQMEQLSRLGYMGAIS